MPVVTSCVITAEPVKEASLISGNGLIIGRKGCVCVWGRGGGYSDFCLLQGLGLFFGVYNFKFRHGRARQMLWVLYPPLTRGKNSFYRAQGGKWAQETCGGCPKQRYATGEPGKVQGRDSVDTVRVPGPWGQYLEKIRFI